MSEINSRLNQLNTGNIGNKGNTGNKGKKGKKNKNYSTQQNALKELDTSKLINNFSQKYNTSSNKETTTEKISHLITENSATIILALIAFTFIVIGIYLYFKEGTRIKQGKTFYGQDLLSYQPIFKLNTDKIEPCIERCKKDTLCKGITYNKDELQCLGTNKGRLRDDEPNQIVWLKDEEIKKELKALTLVGYANSLKIIQANELPKPELPNQFTYSFYLYLKDFYENHGVWRHIFHKGNDMIKMNTPNWEDIIKEIPDQSIGVWLAPFHNNIRIAVTTIQDTNRDTQTYPHANKQEYLPISENNSKPDVFLTDIPNGRFVDKNRATYRKKDNRPNYQKNIEYVDITNVPANKLIHITVCVHELIMEIYLNSKLHKVVELHGYPEFNAGKLTLFQSTQVSADIIDLKYVSGSLKYPAIKKLINNKTQIQEKY